MTPQERSLFDTLGKELSVWKSPEEWAHIAWPTAFVCKRTKKPKAEQSVKNAIMKAHITLTLFVDKGLAEKDWRDRGEGQGHRLIYRRIK